MAVIIVWLPFAAAEILEGPDTVSIIRVQGNSLLCAADAENSFSVFPSKQQACPENLPETVS
jgi:hypothetical protein